MNPSSMAYARLPQKRICPPPSWCSALPSSEVCSCSISDHDGLHQSSVCFLVFLAVILDSAAILLGLSGSLLHQYFSAKITSLPSLRLHISLYHLVVHPFYNIVGVFFKMEKQRNRQWVSPICWFILQTPAMAETGLSWSWQFLSLDHPCAW